MLEAATIELPPDDLTALRLYAERGDPRAFEFLVHRYQAMVLATCLRATRSRADAEDATQETFLKLAQSARRIRSNAAAWLHACALRTSIDLQRRHGSQARAEKGASVAAQTGEDDAERAWYEIKPLLDAALAALHEDDRELIVQRYFVGRLENEMAREAGVNAGTMNRRIDKAVKRLRTHLSTSGLALAGASGLGAALGMGASPPVSAAVTASLMEIGVAGPGAVAAPASLFTLQSSLTFVGGAAVVGAASVGMTFLMPTWMGAPAPAPAPMISLVPAPEKQDRPTGDLGPFKFLSSTLDGVPNGQLTVKDRRFSFKNDFGPGAESAEIVLRIETARGDGRAGTMELKLESTNLPKPNDFVNFIGFKVELTYTIEDNTLSFDAEVEGAEKLRKIHWTGSRMNTARAINRDADALAAVQGTWAERLNWDLTVNKDEISIKANDFELIRYRILEWQTTADAARVQALCVRNVNGAFVGERTKLLVRKTATGYQLALHDTGREKLNVWPSGFVTKPGEGVRVYSFGKE